MDRIVRDAVNLQKADFNARSAQYLEKTKAFQESAYFKKHKWNGMVQLDAAGNPTPRLIGALSGKFEAEVQQKRVEFGDNLDGFYKWMRSRTTTIPIAATYDYSGDTAVRKENPAVMRKLEAELGVLGAEEALNRQDALIQDFIDALFIPNVVTLDLEGDAINGPLSSTVPNR